MNQESSEDQNLESKTDNPFESPEGFLHREYEISTSTEPGANPNSRSGTRLLVGIVLPIPILYLLLIVELLLFKPPSQYSFDGVIVFIGSFLVSMIIGLLPSSLFSIYMEHLVRKANNITVQLFAGFIFGFLPVAFFSPVYAIIPGLATFFSALILWRIKDKEVTTDDQDGE